MCRFFKNIIKAFEKSYESDPKSAFGGIIFLNRKVNLNLAKKLLKIFIDFATEFDEDDKFIKKEKNLILIIIPKIKNQLSEKRSLYW